MGDEIEFKLIYISDGSYSVTEGKIFYNGQNKFRLFRHRISLCGEKTRNKDKEYNDKLFEVNNLMINLKYKIYIFRLITLFLGYLLYPLM